jgi:thioredoxin reductase (NADPH)
MQAGAEKFGAVTIYDEVCAVNLSGEVKKISTAYSGELCARAVIIATGAGPRRLGLDGEEKLVGQGIHYCAHCDGRFYKGKTVAVIGGGNTAVGDALYLANLCERVYLIHRRDAFRAGKILSDALFSKENISLVMNAVPTEIITDGGFGIAVKKRGGEEEKISCDGIFVSIGREPSTSLFAGEIQLDEAGYVVAGEDTKTSIPGVFAAGDVRTKELRQVITAASDGATAAHMAGEYLA